MSMQLCSKRRKSGVCSVATALNGVAASTILAVSAAAVAQETQPGIDEVVVTGSRLVRSDLSAPSPTTVVNADRKSVV